MIESSDDVIEIYRLLNLQNDKVTIIFCNVNKCNIL